MLDTDKSFGQVLKLYRQSHDLTQADLAERVCCATESIRKMEADRQRPSKMLAVRLADILAVPAEERTEFIQLARRRTASPGIRAGASAGGQVVNLPAQTTTLIGRGPEVDATSRMLRAPGVRLVTLTGPGGVGKTRLAARAAQDLLNDFPGGIYFVPLVNISEPGLVGRAIAEVMHIRATPDQLAARLAARCRDGSVLLILDNFEHVRAAAGLIGDLLGAAPLLKVIVTSRTTLALYGENELNLKPLSTPDLRSVPRAEQLMQFDAVRVFDERTRAVKADFVVTDSNATAVAEICCRLDGLPLALELAAAYGKVFSPAMLLNHLKKEPIELAAAAPNLPERHSTLRSTIRWSYDLLSPQEKSVLRQLSVFSGGFTLEAMESVCSLQEGSALTYLGLLLDKSLLQQSDAARDERRYVMLDTIRAFALEQLNVEGRFAETAQRHLEFYLRLAEDNAFGHEASYEWKMIERFEREIANLRAAIGWAIERGAGDAVVHLCSDLEYFWYEFGQPGEVHEWMQAVLTPGMNLSTEMRAAALRFAGYVLMSMQIDYPRAKARFEEALALWKELGDEGEAADTLLQLGIVTLEMGDFKSSETYFEDCCGTWQSLGNANGALWARQWLGVAWIRQGKAQQAGEDFESAVKIWRAQGDLRAEAFSLNYLGVIAMYAGNFGLARAYQDQGLVLWRSIGDTRGVSSSLNALGPVALHQGHPEEARAFLAQSLTLRWESQDINGLAWNLERLAEAAIVGERCERGAQLWGAASALRDRCRSPLFPAEVARLRPQLETARQVLGMAAWNALCAAGGSRPLEAVVSFALEVEAG